MFLTSVRDALTFFWHTFTNFENYTLRHSFTLNLVLCWFTQFYARWQFCHKKVSRIIGGPNYYVPLKATTFGFFSEKVILDFLNGPPIRTFGKISESSDSTRVAKVNVKTRAYKRKIRRRALLTVKYSLTRLHLAFVSFFDRTVTNLGEGQCSHQSTACNPGDNKKSSTS